MNSGKDSSAAMILLSQHYSVMVRASSPANLTNCLLACIKSIIVG